MKRIKVNQILSQSIQIDLAYRLENMDRQLRMPPTTTPHDLWAYNVQMIDLHTMQILKTGDINGSIE
jgi:hypothetical protein